MKNKNEKIHPEEKIILSEYSKAFEERTNSVRERGGFFRTRFDSAETDDWNELCTLVRKNNNYKFVELSDNQAIIIYNVNSYKIVETN